MSASKTINALVGLSAGEPAGIGPDLCLRLAARQALRARKSDEIFDEWIRQLRDQAYVDVRLDEQ